MGGREKVKSGIIWSGSNLDWNLCSITNKCIIKGNAKWQVRQTDHLIHFSSSQPSCYFSFSTLCKVPVLQWIRNLNYWQCLLPTHWSSINQWKQMNTKNVKEKKPPKNPNTTSGSFLVLSFAYTPTQGVCNGMVEFHMNIQLQVVFSKK